MEKSKLHPVLLRQLIRCGYNGVELNKLGINQLLETVSTSYYEIDKDRYLFENSLNIASDEMRSAIQKIQEASHILESTLNSTTDGILLADGQTGKIIISNKQFKEMWKTPDQAIQAKDDEQSLANALPQLLDPDRFIKKVRELYQDPVSNSFDEIYFKDGRVFERFSTPLLINEKMIGRVWSFRDVTERKKYELKLARSERMAAVGNLAAGIAHEINNPLSYAISNLEFILESSSLTADMNRHLLKSLEGFLRVKDIVMGLKTFSKDPLTVEQSLNIHDILDASLRISEGEYKNHARIIKTYGASQLIRGNYSKLSQIFINLIVNAAQAMSAGHVDRNSITIETKDLGKDRVLIRISDTGCGIPREKLKEIFDPFYSTKLDQSGTGLGLFIVQNIIADFGGEISVDSIVDEGTTFSIQLMQSSETLPSVEKSTKKIEDPIVDLKFKTNLNILIIDDEEDLAESNAETLSQFGKAQIAHNGEEALSLLMSQNFNFDVIVCDLMMPRMSGIEFSKILEEKKPGMSQRILFTTGGSYTEVASQFINTLNKVQFLGKPFRISELRAGVQNLLRFFENK